MVRRGSIRSRSIVKLVMETRHTPAVPTSSFFAEGQSAQRRPLHIVIYTLIPASHACQPIQRGPLVALRNRTRRWLELMLWRTFGVWRAHYSTFKDAMHTNRGDVAVGQGVKHQLIEAFAGRHIKFTEIPWCELDDIFAPSSPVDLVVIAGGGYLFADANGRLPPRFARDVEILSQLDCPVVATSIGLNNLISEGPRDTFRFHGDSRADIRQFLARLALISVRDETTQRALAAESFRSIPVIVDPAFVLAPEAMAGQPPPVAPDDCLDIGLNIAFHGTHTAEATRRVLPIFVRVLNRLQAETPCRFTYFVHSDAERGIAEALKIAGIPLTVIYGGTRVDGTRVQQRLRDEPRGDALVGRNIRAFNALKDIDGA